MQSPHTYVLIIIHRDISEVNKSSVTSTDDAMITHVIIGVEPTHSPDIQAWFHYHEYRQHILCLRPLIRGARGPLAQPVFYNVCSHKHPEHAGMGI